MNWQTASGITWTINPTSLMEFRVGASKSEGMKTPATLDGGPSMFDLYGISGLPTDKSLTGGLNTQNITGYASYGRDYTSPQWQNPLVINPKANHCCPRRDAAVARSAENTDLGAIPVGYLVGGLRFELSQPVQVIPKPV
jgi:hypothetical protein